MSAESDCSTVFIDDKFCCKLKVITMAGHKVAVEFIDSDAEADRITTEEDQSELHGSDEADSMLHHFPTAPPPPSSGPLEGHTLEKIHSNPLQNKSLAQVAGQLPPIPPASETPTSLEEHHVTSSGSESSYSDSEALQSEDDFSMSDCLRPCCTILWFSLAGFILVCLFLSVIHPVLLTFTTFVLGCGWQDLFSQTTLIFSVIVVGSLPLFLSLFFTLRRFSTSCKTHPANSDTLPPSCKIQMASPDGSSDARPRRYMLRGYLRAIASANHIYACTLASCIALVSIMVLIRWAFYNADAKSDACQSVYKVSFYFTLHTMGLAVFSFVFGLVFALYAFVVRVACKNRYV